MGAVRTSMLWALVLAASVSAATQGPKIADLKKPAVVTSDTYDEFITTKCAVIFHLAKEDTFEGADELAKELEGLVRIAIINTETQSALIEDKSIEAGDNAWLVKPYGEEELTGYKDLAAAREAAEASNPTDTVTPIADQQAIQMFLSKAYQAVKIPLVLFHDKDDIPALLTKMSLWVGDDFEFGSFSKPPPELVKGMGTDASLPMLLAFVPQEPKDKDAPQGGIQFAPALYDKAKMGKLKFKNVFKFSLILRAELGQMGFFDRRDKAGEAEPIKQKPKGSTKTQPLFEYTAETADACAEDKLGLCVVAILDGSPLNPDKDAQLQVLRDVQESPSNKDRVLHFMWVDQSCHPSFAQDFGVSADVLPAVLAVSPKKQAWAQHFGPFEASKVGGFIGGVLTGRQRISKLPDAGFPSIAASDNCTAAHAALMPADDAEDDVDMDDILKEIQEEAGEDKAEQEQTMADLEAQAVDAEMEAKRLRAEKEAARMNKASNKKRRRKKKKKTTKKKSKDEL
eukprot:m.30662 g.30662  ORF g.30662 m.30662 type:complete len:513 (+) comp4734_c0_seq1:103-1641(+)